MSCRRKATRTSGLSYGRLGPRRPVPQPALSTAAGRPPAARGLRRPAHVLRGLCAARARPAARAALRRLPRRRQHRRAAGRACRASRPDVVVVFRPEIIPRGAVRRRSPRRSSASRPSRCPARARPRTTSSSGTSRAGRAPTARNFDRVVCFDPYGWEAAAARLPVWRCMPLPVDDRLYRPVTAARRPPRVIFIGYSTCTARQYLLRRQARVRHRSLRARPDRRRAARRTRRRGRRHQPARRVEPAELREPGAAAPRVRPPPVLRAARADVRARAGNRLHRDREPRTTSACACTSSTTSPTPSSASASAVATRPTSSAPHASGPT